MVQQAEILEDHADLAAQRGHLGPAERADILPQDRQKAARRAQAQMHHVQEGGLAGAAGAGQEMKAAGLDRDTDVLQYLGADAIPESDIIKTDHRDSGRSGKKTSILLQKALEIVEFRPGPFMLGRPLAQFLQNLA